MAMAQAIFRFQAAQGGDLSFEAGEMITVTDQNNTGWWSGRTQDGRMGIFPYNRVRLMDAPAAAPRAAAQRVEAPFIADRIDKVEVGVVPPGKNRPTAFAVSLHLSNGQTAEGVKPMDQFRLLEQCLVLAAAPAPQNGGFYRQQSNDDAVSYTLDAPKWSDEMVLDKLQFTKRAAQLREFLEKPVGMGETALEYLLVYWLDPSATFNIKPNDKTRTTTFYKQGMEAMRATDKPGSPLLVKAAYDWVQRDDAEISLLKDEIVAVLKKNTMYNGWWMGEKVNGKQGVFPYNYVQEIPDEVAYRVLHPFAAPKATIAAPPFHMNTNASSSAGMLSEKTGVSPSAILPPPGNKTFATESVFIDNTSNKFTGPTRSVAGRNRSRIVKYSLCCTEAFDELLQDGLTIEEDGKLAHFAGRNNTPKKGDTVVVLYSAFIWEPQRQELLEFGSSDVLLGGKGADTAAGPLEFNMGSEQAIEGVEDAVSRMEVGQSVRVTLTPEKGYGDVGYPPDIPGNAYLVYDLTLEEVKRKGKNVPNSNGANPHVGAAGKSSVANRKKSGNFKQFQGYKSMQQLRNVSNQEKVFKSKRRLENLGGNAPAMGAKVGAVNNEKFKKKLTLAQLQEIVRKRQYEEYGIVPGIMEEYLTEEEFQKAFNVDHFTWLLMPAFRRKQLKQELQLF